jgi:uncharacterized protein YcbK (DUF882 family)
MDVNKINTNFKRSEFTCGCGCGFDTVDVRLADIIQQIRTSIQQPISPSSGCRCKPYNDSLPNSSPTSQHIQGKAADIPCKGELRNKIYALAATILDGNGGLGIYDTWVHIDVRSGIGQRWDKRS